MESGLTIAGKYRLGELLGAGGMASVWSAVNIFTERKFAIKFMLPAVARTPEAAKRFLMEAKVSARVNHPNVIEIIDVGQTEEGTLFLVMELLNGVSLETAMRKQKPPMTMSEFTFVMLEVSRALAAAHKSGVIHRDLKPTNIFLHKDRDGTPLPKLLDFGVSKFLEGSEGDSGLTVAGTVLGSPLYMSPEQAKGDSNIDARTDVFAFGGILFEALAGVRAYDGVNFNQLIVAIATTPPKSIDKHAPYVPESLRSVVRDCLVTDREKRLGSFDVIADRLKRAMPELETLPLRIPAPGKTEPIVDPDATQALPIARGNEKALSLSSSGSSGLSKSGTSGPTGFSSPWATPPPGPQGPTTTVNNRASSGNSRGARVFVVIALGATLAGGAAFGVMRLRPRFVGRSGPIANAPPALPTTPSSPSSGPSATAAPSTDVPSISVEALPVATSAPAAPLAKGYGRLTITASKGSCTVIVDGTNRGVTPIAALDLPAGAHLLRCEPPNNGRPKTAAMVIQDGATTRYKFATDE